VSAVLQSEAVADDAERFLALLAPGEPITFQTFDDRKRKPDPLAKWMHGTLAQHRHTLADLNARGAGVYWMVNAGDGKGRKGGNVRRIRALFVDLDGAPLGPVRAAALQPHCIVETSPGRWHAYWRIADCPPLHFTALQKGLAARFHADARVHDLPRVMRLPGFDHRKGKPCRCRIIQANPLPPYTLAELVEAFGPRALETPASNVTRMPAPVKQTGKNRRTLPKVIPKGGRNATLFSLARGLVQKGHDAQAVTDRLQRVNAERCKPPLCASEVDGIAAQAVGYGSDGFITLSHRLFDSREWLALAPTAQAIVMLAFRRYNGSNNGNIALTWADFRGREGFGQKHAFYRHRKRAVQTGILQPSIEGRNSQAGRKPDLFAIAAKWIPPVSKKEPGASVQKGTPTYINRGESF